jgi:hypothetical protein
MGDFELKAARPSISPGPTTADLRHDQAHYVEHNGKFNSLRKLAGGLTRRFTGALEQTSSERQTPVVKITELNVAKMLAGIQDDGDAKIKSEPFTRADSFASLGYLGNAANYPDQYAAMLFAQRELVIAGALEEQPNPNFPGTYWFKVASPTRLMNIATSDPKLDKSLTKILSPMASEAERDSYVSDFLQRNQVKLDLAI